MNNTRRTVLHIFSGALLVLCLSLAGGIVTFAEDYRILGAYWDNDATYPVKALWDKPESSTEYWIRLYRNGTAVDNWFKIHTTTYDFSSVVAKKGTGDYVFRIFPDKVGESLMTSSDVLEVDSTYLKAVQNRVKQGNTEQQQAFLSVTGWHSAPGNNWQYVKDNHTLARKEWLQIPYNGTMRWFYFDNNAYMAKGWIKLTYWYYLGEDGALYQNTTTPDGYLVNGDGVWVDQYGNPMGISTPQAVKAYNVSVTLTESGSDGDIKNAQVTGVSGADLISWKTDIPYDRWEADGNVHFTVTLRTSQGNALGMKAHVNNARNIKISGENPVYVEFDYTPTVRLKAPTGLHVTNGGYLEWIKVPRAVKYRVTIYDSGSSKASVMVEDTMLDMNQYCDQYNDVNVTVSAIGRTNAHKESAQTKLGRVNDLVWNTSGLNGEFQCTSEHLHFIDSEGKRVKGWQQLTGFWYFFDSSGNAVGPGWYQDASSGYWYYFDNNLRMMTGTVQENGKSYWLNDGSDGSLPYGAWRQ